MGKSTVRTWVLSFILFTVMTMYYMVLTNNISLEIPSNFIVSVLIAFIPSIIFTWSLHYAAMFMYKHEKGKAVWKFPIILLIVLAVIAVVFTIYTAFTCYGESCMGVFFLVVFGLPAVLGFTVVFSLLPSLAIRYSNRQKRRVFFLFSIALIVLFCILILSTYFTCNFGYDPKCLAFNAHESGDYDICEKAANGITRDRCFINVAYQSMDVSICDNVMNVGECKEYIESSRQKPPLVEQ